MKIRRSIWIAAGVTLAFVACAMLLVDVVPPASLTDATMVVVRQRIMRFATLHERLPSSLAETEAIPGKVNSLNDAWRHPILYSYDTNEVVTLRSLGKDDRFGGIGANRDMIGTFAARGADGQWASQSWDWIKDPLEEFR